MAPATASSRNGAMVASASAVLALKAAAAAATAALLVANARADAVPPPSWQPAVAALDMLWTPSDANISANVNAGIGNGFLGTMIHSVNLYASGVYNGYGCSTPSHGVRIPATNNVNITGTSVSDAALNVAEATYYRRSWLDPSAPGSCTVNSTSTCSNAPGRVWVEQRWYAHRLLSSIMVMEVEVLDTDEYAQSRRGQHRGDSSNPAGAAASPYVMLQLANDDGGPSPDALFLPVPVPPAAGYSIINGSTIIPETNSSGLQALAVLTTNLGSGASNMLAVSAPSVTYAFFTVVRTTVETPAAALVAGVQADYAVALQFAANGTLHSSHVAEWAETIWASGVDIVGRPDVALAVNTSLYAIASSARGDRPTSTTPGGLQVSRATRPLPLRVVP